MGPKKKEILKEQLEKPQVTKKIKAEEEEEENEKEPKEKVSPSQEEENNNNNKEENQNKQDNPSTQTATTPPAPEQKKSLLPDPSITQISNNNNNINNNNNNNNNNSTEEVDISTPCWFYEDSQKLRQGPFCFREMYLWWKSGYFPEDLPVKTVWEPQFQPLHSCPDFKNITPLTIKKINEEQAKLSKEPPEPRISSKDFGLAPSSATHNNHHHHNPANGGHHHDYTITGAFNARTGSYTNLTTSGNPLNWDPKMGERESRQLNVFFDYNKYAHDRAASSEKDQKAVKGSKKFWKERKEKKKREKLVNSYLN